MKYLSIFSLPFLLLNSCVKEKCQIAGSYEFEIPATLNPAKDTFQIGDTISIVSSFDDQVFDRKTKKFYKLENFKFYPGTGIVKIDSLFSISKISNYFDLLIDSSQDYHLQQFNDGAEYIFGQYKYLNKKYQLNYKIIARYSGLYYLEQSIDPSIKKEQTFDGKCSNIDVGGVVKMNEGTDNNIEMLKGSPDAHYNEWIFGNPEQRFHQFGGYCFYVK